LSWYFDQVLFGTDVCDYELTSIENGVLKSPRGVFDRDGKKSFAGVESDGIQNTKIYDSKVIVSRLGEMKMPTSVLVHFENGQEVREPWDGQSRWAEFKYRRPEKILWAMVDPDTVMVIDINLNNNSKTTEPERTPIWKYTVKFLFWLQHMLQLGAVLG
jgi:transposase